MHFGRQLQGIPSKNSRTHVLFKFTWNILRARPPARLQNRASQNTAKCASTNLRGQKLYQAFFSSDHSGLNLETNYGKKNGKNSNMWRLNNRLLKKQWVNEEIKGEIRKYFKTNERKNTTFQNLWDGAEAVLRGTFIVTKAYLKKIRKISNNLTYPLKELEKEEQTKPKVSRRKEIIKSRVETETFLKREKINETKRCFFKKINKIEKTLATLIEKKRIK